MTVPTTDTVAEALATLGGQIPDDNDPSHQNLRAIVFMIAGILDMATPDELIIFASSIYHFGSHHCAAIQKDTASGGHC